MTEYEIGKAIGRCAISGRELLAGETFYTALFERPDGFERRDYAAECWSEAPEGAFCTFKTRIVEKQQRRRAFVDDDVLVNLFLRLGECDDDNKRSFRFVLTLIMMRKRLLKYEQSLRNDAGETWQVRLTRDSSLHMVHNPRLDEEQVAAVSAELDGVLQGFGDDEAVTSGDAT